MVIRTVFILLLLLVGPSVGGDETGSSSSSSSSLHAATDPRIPRRERRIGDDTIAVANTNQDVRLLTIPEVKSCNVGCRTRWKVCSTRCKREQDSGSSSRRRRGRGRRRRRQRGGRRATRHCQNVCANRRSYCFSGCVSSCACSGDGKSGDCGGCKDAMSKCLKKCETKFPRGPKKNGSDGGTNKNNVVARTSCSRRCRKVLDKPMNNCLRKLCFAGGAPPGTPASSPSNGGSPSAPTRPTPAVPSRPPPAPTPPAPTPPTPTPPTPTLPAPTPPSPPSAPTPTPAPA